MFDLKRLIQMGRATHQPASGPSGRTLSAVEPVTLVAIMQSRDDSEALRRIAASYGWGISIVDSSTAAIASLNKEPAPLVICDSDLSSEAWHDVLAQVAAQPQAVCVLLASRVVDDYLWNQVIRHHGYDVVRKPFQPEELHRAVTLAWSWRGWAHRHYAEGSRKPTV